VVRPFRCRAVAAPRCVLVVCATLLAVALTGCGTHRVAGPAPLSQAAEEPPAPAPPQTIAPGAVPAEPGAQGARVKVALLLPLSGANAGLGHAILDAAQMALFDVGGDDLVLLPRDTQGSADGAARAAQAVLAEGPALILGPLLAAEVEAVKPLAKQANVNMIAFSTAEQLAGDGTYLLSFLARQNVERIVAFAHARGAARFAVLAPSTPYGELVIGDLRSAVATIGASLGHVETYDPAATDLRPVVRRLADFDERSAALARERRQLETAGDEASRLALRRLAGRDTFGDPDFDAVLLPDGGAKLKAVASLLPYYDIDPAKVHILGTGLWDEPGIGSEPALVGGWFAAPNPAARSDFETRFQALYKQKPPRLASLGYDAAALAAVLAQRPNGSGFSAAALTDPSGFAGVDGIFRFRPDGQAERGLAVLQVERSGTTVVSPAPETFESQPAS
jgi:branched-chain amino acid transport system substrate-binding protein